jgi:hypothetical protein
MTAQHVKMLLNFLSHKKLPSAGGQVVYLDDYFQNQTLSQPLESYVENKQ